MIETHPANATEGQREAIVGRGAASEPSFERLALCSVVVVVVLVASATACTDGSGRAPRASALPRFGLVAVGRDGCEYRFVGGERWTPGEWCVDLVQRGVGDVYPFGHPDRGLATIDVSTPPQLLAFPYGIDLWMRIPASAEAEPQVLYLERWMSAPDYISLLARQAAGADLDAARDEARRDLKAFMRLADSDALQRLRDAAMIFREPPCRWSGDRCIGGPA